MSQINVGEAYYMAVKKKSGNLAQNLQSDIQKLPVSLESATDSRVMDAASIKSQYVVSYADAFAVALAIELNAAVISDTEFKQVEALIKIEWIV
jgi:ribonuclease VapC